MKATRFVIGMTIEATIAAWLFGPVGLVVWIGFYLALFTHYVCDERTKRSGRSS